MVWMPIHLNFEGSLGLSLFNVSRLMYMPIGMWFLGILAIRSCDGNVFFCFLILDTFLNIGDV